MMLCAWILECTVSFSCYILLDLFLIVLKFSSLSLWLWNSHWSGPPPDFRSDQHIHTYVVNYFSTYHDTCIQRHLYTKRFPLFQELLVLPLDRYTVFFATFYSSYYQQHKQHTRSESISNRGAKICGMALLGAFLLEWRGCQERF